MFLRPIARNHHTTSSPASRGFLLCPLQAPCAPAWRDQWWVVAPRVDHEQIKNACSGYALGVGPTLAVVFWSVTVVSGARRRS